MRFNVKDANTLSIVHDKSELLFNLSAYKQTKLKTLDDPYRDINDWFAAQPNGVQEAIFDIYKEARISLTEIRDVDYLGDTLARLCDALYRYVTYDSVEALCKRLGYIQIPLGAFKVAHDPNDKMPERTYLVEDYWNLLMLAVCLRPILPIWAEYTNTIDKYVGNNFKEQVAVSRLLIDTWLPQCVPMVRLRRYVEILTEGAKLAPATYDSMSSTEFPDWLLALILVRKVCIGDVVHSDGKGSLIANVFSFIDSTIKGLETRFLRVGNKFAVKDAGADDERSVLDDSRVRQNTTIGATTVLEHYCQNVYGVVRAVDPTVPLALITGALEAQPLFVQKSISKFHIRTVQWCVCTAVPAREIEALPKPYHIALINAARVLLWHWGHRELSLLLSAPHPPVQMDDVIDGVTSSHRTRVKPELIEELITIYPHGPKDSDAAREGRATKQMHPVYRATNLLKDELPNRLWKVYPIQGTDVTGLVDSTGLMPTPEDIHSLIVRLAIDIGKRRNLVT